MKNIFPFFILFTIAFSAPYDGFDFNQIPGLSDGAIKYEAVVDESSNRTKDVLYSTAITWIAQSYNSANHVVQLSDKEMGKIVIQAGFSIPNYPAKQYTLGLVKYTLTLQFKDGRWKYTFDNFRHDASTATATVSSLNTSINGLLNGGVSGMSKAISKLLLYETHQRVTDLIIDLKLEMKKGISEESW